MSKVAIVGAGFTGLAAAWRLRRLGHQVTIFEKNPYPGGLAAGFKASGWNWSLEHHYHHIFSGDKTILQFAHQLGLRKKFFFRQPKTSVYYQNKIFRLDSPMSLFQVPVLSLTTKLRVAVTLAVLKLMPETSGRQLEKFTAQAFLQKTMGDEAWRVLWQPLFQDKFSVHAAEVNAAWFWARIKARTPRLGYFVGGFGQFAQDTVQRLHQVGVETHFNADVTLIESANSPQPQWQLRVVGKHFSNNLFDQVLITLPAHQLTQLTKVSWPDHFKRKIKQLDYVSAITLIIEAEKPFFHDQTYWLNVNERQFPFLAVVEQTNFIDRRYYGGKHIIYVGQYLSQTDKLYSLDATQLLEHYRSALDQLSPGFSQSIKRVWRFRTEFAQPIVKTNHSRLLPQIKTPIKGLYWASMQHIYPWDRGTNFAVKLGEAAAETIHHAIN